VRNREGISVIITTGYSTLENAILFLKTGACDFLPKPFNSIDLQARARAHCNYQREALALKKQITVDALTGFSNQPSFLEQLTKDLAFARRHSQSVAILIADMADYKSFFMQHGKQAADAALSHAARLVRNCIRTKDTPGRYSFSTLAISLPSTPNEGAMTLLEKVQQALRNNPLQVNGRVLPLKWRFSVHLPGISASTDAQTEVQAAISKLGLEAVVAVHATVKPPAASLDKALAQLKGFGEWLMILPNDQMTLSRIAKEVLTRFS